MIAELVIGEGAPGLGSPVYVPGWIAVDEDGRLYVVDSAVPNIRVFDAEGRELRTISRPGEGPGELEVALGVVARGESVLAVSGRERLSRWTADGGHMADYRPLAAGQTFFALLPSTESTVVAGYIRRSGGSPASVLRVARLSLQGEQEVVYADLPLPPRSRAANTAPMPTPRPSFATSPTGRVYTTPADEYSITAFEHSGEASWTIRTSGATGPPTEVDVARTMELVGRNRPSAVEAELLWPARRPAISHIAVDGHGHVYVYPFAWREDPPGDRPVDVFAPDGTRVFAGMVPDVLWWTAQDDSVFHFESDPETGEYQVVRWRLVEPF